MVSDIDPWKPRTEIQDEEIPHYGGFIRNNSYIGGKFDYYDMVDKDRMSMIELDGMVKGLNKRYVGSRIDY
ncbi:hypothetical protein M0R45_035639 [Rubus argutus]|uniref:PB1-like domain-containing protein n=1 Tax=Rubus argutus TaxID=59490 RepID=A0AAW1VUL9_RUBAR